MRYAITRYKSQQRDLVYRIYVTDCLRMLTENTAKASGGRYVTADYLDIINKETKKSKSGEEIVAGVIKASGIKIV